MIINLCFDSKKALDIVKKFPYEKVLDITGVLYQKKIENELILVREIDKTGKIERQSLNFYVETIGKLSEHKINKNQTIRDIQVNNIPLFWFTDIAVKHHFYHWGQVYFFLLQLIEDKGEMFTNDIKIILHKSSNKSETSIRATIGKHLKDAQLTFFSTNTLNKRFVSLSMVLVKESLLFVKFKLKHSKNKKKGRTSKIDIFITNNIKSVNNNCSNFDIGWKKNIIDKAGGKSYNIPYVSSFGKLPKFNNKILQRYLNYAPSIFQFISMSFSLIFYYFKIKKKIKNDFSHKSINFHKDLLISEFRNSIFNLSLFINKIWLSNFSKKTEFCNYYYSDELYKTGRIISLSIKTKNTTIGIQHGLIPVNHTVYRPTDNEQSGENKLPLPERIILWDNIFKKRLLLNSQKIEKRIIISNNEQYINFREEVLSKIEEKNKLKKNILWCTTLPEHFIFEANIINKIMNNNYNIIIRLHPVGHISREFVKETLENNISYSISNNNIISDFALADIVITNPYSTIFYDAINLNIPVVRILNYSTFIDFQKDFKGRLFDIWTHKELNKILDEKLNF